ncbi:hypothetical protein SDC9_113060 [bioreactor metagenome]|uniref:Uncharacterized protein n=1 Tax=bioreactor metagenome TaxID=1076179 RepID=A0A645BSF2_9ZZZZ
MVEGQQLNLAAQHLASPLLNRHLRGSDAALAGDGRVHPGLVHDHANADRSAALRMCAHRRQYARSEHKADAPRMQR